MDEFEKKLIIDKSYYISFIIFKYFVNYRIYAFDSKFGVAGENMQVVRRAEHASRRQQHQRRVNTGNKHENSSDIEGTACRVASCTLNTESDSRTSADAPTSFRNKRRKKVTRREKLPLGTEMEVDEQQPPWKKLSSPNTIHGTIREQNIL